MLSGFSGTSLRVSFSAWFLKKKHLSCYILLIDQISLSDCLYFVRDWAIWYRYFNCLLTRLWRHELWNYYYLSIWAISFYIAKKTRQKFKYYENEKAFNIKQKAFFNVFEGLSLRQIKHFFRSWESDINGFNWFYST